MPLSEAQKRKKEELVRQVREEYDGLIAKGMMKSNAVVAVAYRHELSHGTVQNYLKETEGK